jgi:hypothetical protein
MQRPFMHAVHMLSLLHPLAVRAGLEQLPDGAGTEHCASLGRC